MKKLFLFLIYLWCFSAFGQEVNKEFKKTVFNEQFDNTDKWNTTFNSDNLFLGQNGYYELFRRSKKSGYYLLPSTTDIYSSFQLECNVMFGQHNNKKQSAGVLMMASSESSGGILVEINQKREYRILRLNKDKQVAIHSSGNSWVKLPSVITKSENTIVVKTYNKVYDLYINSVFVTTFTDIELNKGKVGLYIGPDSKAKFDFLKLYLEEKVELRDLETNTTKEEEQAFTQIIIKLKDQIIRKDKEIDELKTKIKLNNNQASVRQNDTGLLNSRNRLQMRVTELEDEVDEMSFKLIQLKEENERLKDFKQGIEKGDENGDIIINLTNMVSNQKKTIDVLTSQNGILNQENNSLFIELKDITKTLDKTTNQLTTEKEKNSLLKQELDSMKRLNLKLQDSINQKNQLENTPNQEPKKPLTEEEILKQMIEKEREERRKKLEEEKQKQEQGQGQNEE